MRPGPEQILTLPNALTLVRIPLAAAVWVAPGSAVWLASVLAAAGLSDALDGRVARAIRNRRARRGEDPARIGQARRVGAWLDPLCDKLFVVSVLVAVAVAYDPSLPVVALIATRELVLVPFVLLYQFTPSLRRGVTFDYRADRIGKATTGIQFAAILSIVFWPLPVRLLAVLAALIGMAAAVNYLLRALGDVRTAERRTITARWIDLASSRPEDGRWDASDAADVDRGGTGRTDEDPDRGADGGRGHTATS